MNYIKILLLSLGLLSMTFVETGCKNTSTSRATYTTLYTAGTGVNTGYAAYLDQVVAGKATYSTSVAKAFNDFQAAYNVAVNVASQNLSALAPQNIVDLANAFYAAVKQFTK